MIYHADQKLPKDWGTIIDPDTGEKLPAPKTKPEPECICEWDKHYGEMIHQNPKCPLHGLAPYFKRKPEPEPEWVDHLNAVADVNGNIPVRIAIGYCRGAVHDSQASLLERVEEWLRHSDDCILSSCHAGRPTKNGGYEQMYGDKWYQSKPVDKTPKCNCGLDDELAKLKGEK